MHVHDEKNCEKINIFSFLVCAFKHVADGANVFGYAKLKKDKNCEAERKKGEETKRMATK